MKNIAVILPFMLLANVNLIDGATMYVTTQSGSSIYKITPNGAVTSFSPLTNGTYGGLVFDSSGNLYVANNGSTSALSEIDKITSSGAVSVYATLPPDAGLRGLAFDSRGDLYAAEQNNGVVARITPDGIISTINLNPNGNGNSNLQVLFGPAALAFDNLGNLFVSEPIANRVSKIMPNGAVSDFCTINSPASLVIDSNNNLYVSSWPNAITEVTPSGTPSAYAALPQFSDPTGLIFDNDNNLFVAEYNTGGISMISPIGAAGLLTTNFNTSIGSPQFLAFAPTPEPASMSLCAFGCLTLLRRRRTI